MASNNEAQKVQGQNDKILRHLQRGHSLTPLQALSRFGSLRLGARIYELKRDGHAILTEIVRDRRSGKRYAKYSMPRAA